MLKYNNCCYFLIKMPNNAYLLTFLNINNSFSA